MADEISFGQNLSIDETASPQKARPAFACKDAAAIELTCILIVRPVMAKNDTHCTAWHLRPLVEDAGEQAHGADVMNIFVLHPMMDAGRDLGAFYPSWLGSPRPRPKLLSRIIWRQAGEGERGRPCAMPSLLNGGAET